jgi:hypothetical protein
MGWGTALTKGGARQHPLDMLWTLLLSDPPAGHLGLHHGEVVRIPAPNEGTSESRDESLPS